MATIKEFWDSAHRKQTEPIKIEEYDFKDFMNVIDKVLSLNANNVLDLGCGCGYASVYLAKKGINVTAIDFSEEAIEYAKKLAEYNDVKIDAVICDFFDIDKLETKYDAIIGKFVLHHIEPFEEFALVMKNAMALRGGGVFYENSTRSKLLMFFRKYLVGRFGIPKWSDDEEYPFSPEEIQILRNHFGKVKITYPKFMFFELFALKIFKNKRIVNLFILLDRFIYKLRLFNKFSYYQILEFCKDG